MDRSGARRTRQAAQESYMLRLSKPGNSRFHMIHDDG
jgi:hypothetical protein